VPASGVEPLHRSVQSRSGWPGEGTTTIVSSAVGSPSVAAGPDPVGPAPVGPDEPGLDPVGPAPLGPDEPGLDPVGPDEPELDPLGPDPLGPDPLGPDAQAASTATTAAAQRTILIRTPRSSRRSPGITTVRDYHSRL
jgi:hypothetical protein